MKKILLGFMLMTSSMYAMSDTESTNSMKEMPNYNYTVTYVGEEIPKTLLFSFMGQASSNETIKQDECSETLGQHYLASKKESATTVLTVLPLEKKEDKVKTILIYEKSYPNPENSDNKTISLKLSDNCTINAGSSLTAKSTFIQDFELDKETRLTLGNGKEISVKVNQTH